MTIPTPAGDVSEHEAWLVRTAALELRLISLSQQRSHTARLVRLLLADQDCQVYCDP